MYCKFLYVNNFYNDYVSYAKKEASNRNQLGGECTFYIAE